MAPLYEYACSSCQHLFEERVSSHDSPAPQCPRCGEAQARKQISRFAISGQGDLRESTMHGCHGPYYSEASKADSKPDPQHAKTSSGCGHGGGCSH